MARGLIFVDTAAIVALINSDDQLHGRAVTVQRSLATARARLLTTEWVLLELLNFVAARGNLRRAGVQAVDGFLASPSVTIVPATHEGWLAALSLYRSRTDKEWSLVDCASMLTCRQHSVRRVFTADHHFAQAGFDILLK